jgi:hypothetical protein
MLNQIFATTHTNRFFYLSYEINNNFHLVLFVADLKNAFRKKPLETYRVEHLTVSSKKGLEGKKVIQVAVTFENLLPGDGVTKSLFCFGYFCPTNIEVVEYPEIALRSTLKHFEVDSQPSSHVLYSSLPIKQISAFFGLAKMRSLKFVYLSYKIDDTIPLIHFVADLKYALEKRNPSRKQNKVIVQNMTASFKRGFEGKKTVQLAITFEKPLQADGLPKSFFCFGNFCPTIAEKVEFAELALRSTLKHFEVDSQPSLDMLYSSLPIKQISSFFGK